MIRMDAFASLINNNVSEIIKVLTLIIMLPNLVATLYGMNVPLPLQDRPYAFFVVAALCVSLAGGSLFYFVRKKWF